MKDLGATQQGYTDLVKRELGVSLRPEARYTQLHELSHVKHSLWSPAKVVETARRRGIELDPTHVLAAEDARINELLLRAVPDAHDGYRHGGEPLRTDLLGYVASHATPPACVKAIADEAALEPRVREAVDKALRELAAKPDDRLTVWGVTVPLARLIGELLAPPPSSPSSKSGDGESGGESDAGGEDADADPTEDGGDGDGGDRGEAAPAEDETAEDAGEDKGESGAGDGGGDVDAGDGESAGEDGEDGAESAPSKTDGKAEAGSEAAETSDESESDEDVFGESDVDGHPGCARGRGDGSEGTVIPWLIPEVRDAKLTVPCRGRTNAAVRSGESGSVLRWTHLHRVMTDGQVFRRVAHRPGALQRGTCLVDVSGSMSFGTADLEALLDVLPHATVAVYCGTRDTATLTVVARGGYRADAAELGRARAGYGNTCDGPALLWLSRQQRPLLWVCDGQVTGDGDAQQRWMTQECAAIVKAARIVQILKVWDPRGSRLTATATMSTDGASMSGLSPAELARVLRDVERGLVR